METANSIAVITNIFKKVNDISGLNKTNLVDVFGICVTIIV